MKKSTFREKTKVVYNTEPKQFWCATCQKSTNIMYFDKNMRYCERCFNGEENEYIVIEEHKKGGWLE